MVYQFYDLTEEKLNVKERKWINHFITHSTGFKPCAMGGSIRIILTGQTLTGRQDFGSCFGFQQFFIKK